MIPNDNTAISSIMSRLGVSKSFAGGGEAPDESGLDTAAEELISAIHSKNPAAVAAAFRSVFSILEMEPHAEESPSEGVPNLG